MKSHDSCAVRLAQLFELSTLSKGLVDLSDDPPYLEVGPYKHNKYLLEPHKTYVAECVPLTTNGEGFLDIKARYSLLERGITCLPFIKAKKAVINGQYSIEIGCLLTNNLDRPFTMPLNAVLCDSVIYYSLE